MVKWECRGRPYRPGRCLGLGESREAFLFSHKSGMSNSLSLRDYTIPTHFLQDNRLSLTTKQSNQALSLHVEPLQSLHSPIGQEEHIALAQQILRARLVEDGH